MNFEICEKCFDGNINWVRMWECKPGKIFIIFISHLQYNCPHIIISNDIGKFKESIRGDVVDNEVAQILPKEIFDRVYTAIDEKLNKNRQCDMTIEFFQENVLGIFDSFLLVPRACPYYAEHMVCDLNRKNQS